MSQPTSTMEHWLMVSPPIKRVLADNLRALMDAHPDLGTIPSIELATAMRGCKVGKSTVDRVLRAETPVNVEYVEAFAKVFDLAPWQLLVPNLDVKNPQVLRATSVAEDALYQRIRQVAKEITELPKER